MLRAQAFCADIGTLSCADLSNTDFSGADLSNTDLSNAFGNCVAQKLGTATTKLQASLSTAAKTCRSMRSTNPTGFRNTYGNRSNAFAKCVVAHAQTK